MFQHRLNYPNCGCLKRRRITLNIAGNKRLIFLIRELSMSLKNQVALITGASQGIGQAIAETLAKAGLNLVLAARQADKLSALQQRLQKTYPDQSFIVQACDVRQAKSVE